MIVAVKLGERYMGRTFGGYEIENCKVYIQPVAVRNDKREMVEIEFKNLDNDAFQESGEIRMPKHAAIKLAFSLLKSCLSDKNGCVQFSVRERMPE